MAKPSGMVTAIVAKLKKDRGGMSSEPAPVDPDAENEGSEDMGLESCGEDLISAFKAGDASGVVSALKAFFDMYQGESSEDEE